LDLKKSKINVCPKKLFGQNNFLLVSIETLFTQFAKCLFGSDHGWVVVGSVPVLPTYQTVSVLLAVHIAT